MVLGNTVILGEKLSMASSHPASLPPLSKEIAVEVQMQFNYIGAMYNQDGRDPNLATGEMLGWEAQDNGFQGNAGIRWPLQQKGRHGDPAHARRSTLVERQRDVLIPALAKKISEGATVSSVLHDMESLYSEKIRLKKEALSGENFD